MEWLTAVSRLAGFVSFGALLGWYLGSALWGALVAAIGALLFWSLQIWRVQQWLSDSASPPPDLHGIWSDH